MVKLRKTVCYMFFGWPPFLIAGVTLWLFSQSDVGAAYYGQLAPVVTQLDDITITPEIVNGASGSRISGTAVIERDSCDYLNIEWRLHGENRSVSVAAFFTDDAEIRTNGATKWEALMVGIPPHKLNESSGDVLHQCGMFPVMTPFFRPDDTILPDVVGATALCRNGAYSSSTGPGTCSGQGGVEEWLL